MNGMIVANDNESVIFDTPQSVFHKRISALKMPVLSVVEVI